MEHWIIFTNITAVDGRALPAPSRMLLRSSDVESAAEVNGIVRLNVLNHNDEGVVVGTVIEFGPDTTLDAIYMALGF